MASSGLCVNTPGAAAESSVLYQAARAAACWKNQAGGQTPGADLNLDEFRG